MTAPRMDLMRNPARIVSARWRLPAVRSAPGSVARSQARPRHSRPSFASTGPGRSALPTSSSRTARLPKTSHKRRFWRRFGTWTASTGAARSGRGCTGSSSTAPSTGPVPARCGARPGSRSSASGTTTPRTTSSPEIPSPRTSPAGSARSSPEHRAVVVLRYLLDYTPGEIAELLELPRGTVNSRLRRGLDHLEEILDRRRP